MMNKTAYPRNQIITRLVVGLLSILFFIPVLSQNINQPAEQNIGVLVLAHGGSKTWNNFVHETVKPLKAKYHVEVAFGMANPVTIQKGISSLETKGVETIVVVPLFISSHSPIIRQTKYLLGLTDSFPKEPMIMIMDSRFNPLWKEINKLPPFLSGYITSEWPSTKTFSQLVKEYMEDSTRIFISQLYEEFLIERQKRLSKIKPLKTKARIIMTSALDDNPEVINIVYERIKELSTNPENETIILVGHGPNAEEDNRKWLATMKRIADSCLSLIQKEHNKKFKNIFCITVRDDAPKPIYLQAKEHLRALVRQAGKTSTVIVIPLLLAQGGIEKGIVKRLEGLNYKWNGKTLLPHPLITEFIDRSVQEALKKN